MINSIFKDARESPQIYEHLFHFLREEVTLGDLRLEGCKSALTSDQIRRRIRDNISDESLDQWVLSTLGTGANIPFPGMIEEVGRCLGGLALVRSLIRTLNVATVLEGYLNSGIPSSARKISELFEGSQRDPNAAAEVAYEFIETVRDKGRKPALIGFFEGFKAEASMKFLGTGVAKISWTSAPMMKAFIESDQSQLAEEFEEFFKLYLRRKLHSGDAKTGKWQREYDQHFQMLINLKSGMFLPGVDYTYGEKPSP